MEHPSLDTPRVTTPATVTKPVAPHVSGAEKQKAFLKVLRNYEICPTKGPDTPRRSQLQTLRNLCKREVESLRSGGFTINTVKTFLSSYRNAIRERLDGEEQSYTLKYLTLTKEEWDWLKQTSADRTNREMGNLRPIHEDGKIEAARKSLHDSSYSRQAVAMMLLTGRRSIEILKTAKFSVIPGEPNKVLFEGQAKSLDERPAYAHYVVGGVPATEIVTAIGELRAKCDFTKLEPIEVNSKCAKTLGEMTEKLFGTDEKGGKIKPKDLRSIYKEAVCLDFKPGNVAKSLFVAEQLGHRSEVTTVEGGKMLNPTVADKYEDFQLLDRAARAQAIGAPVAPQVAPEVEGVEDAEVDPELVGEAAGSEIEGGYSEDGNGAPEDAKPSRMLKL